MSLNGIDISSWQADLEPAKMVTTDFVVVKATGGTSYANPCFSRHAAQVLAAGKLLGCYHYAREAGCKGTAKAEATHFCEVVAPYVGKAVLVLDWEEELSLGVAWAKAWLDEVVRLTGVKPLVYMSKSVTNSFDWAGVALAGHGLWAAQYPDYSQTGYKAQPWTDPSPFGAWGKQPMMFQYTSSGRVAGYAGNLDLNLFHGSKSDWVKLALDTRAATAEAVADLIDVADVAATIHADMCADAANGYSQSPRWGEDGLGVKKLVIGGREYQYDRGSYDCSSSIVTACNEALRHTAYKDALKGATYTGNILQVFMASGLFEQWRTAGTVARRGDVYLNCANHTAMCQSAEPDMLSEFSIDENGRISGGKVGDQTGREAYVHAFYEYWAGWDYTLHWKGPLPAAPSTSGANKASQASQSGSKKAEEKAAGAAPLAVDGVWGELTTRELQRQLGVTADGLFGPRSCKALQKKLKVAEDGIFGPVTKKALQKKLGVAQDGVMSSATVRALQKALNAGKVAKW